MLEPCVLPLESYLTQILSDVTSSRRTSPSYKTNTITIVKLNHREFSLNELNDNKCYDFISVRHKMKKAFVFSLL